MGRYIPLFSPLILVVFAFTVHAQAGGFSRDSVSGMIGSNSGGGGGGGYKPKNPRLGPLGDRRSAIVPAAIVIIDATVGPMKEIEAVGGKRAVSEKNFVQLKITIENVSKGPIPYYSWSYHAFAPFSVKDAAGMPVPIWKPRQLIPNGAFTYPQGGVRVGGTLKPGTEVVDIIAFEAPANLKQAFSIELPGRNISSPKPYTFKTRDTWFDNDAPPQEDKPKKKPKK